MAYYGFSVVSLRLLFSQRSTRMRQSSGDDACGVE